MIKGKRLFKIFLLLNRKGVKLIVLGSLFLFCIFIAWLMDQYDPGGNAYTHIFYLPVIICSIWVEILISPILIDTTCIGTVFLCTDITERKKTEEVIVEAIHKDDLTGLYNRRYIDKMMDFYIAKSLTSEISFTILMLDIDFFKKVNDTFGHPTGDLVLSKIGEILKESVRNTDYVGRFGGEEFMILLPDINVFGGISLAEKIRMCISKYEFSQVGHITVSVGVAEYHFEETKELLCERADQALYMAKRRGRNRVAIYSKYQFENTDFSNIEYKSGNSKIDQQHEKLLLLFQSILTAYMENQPRDKIYKVFLELKKQLLAHFSYEEYALKEKNYKDLVEHQKKHEELIRDMEQLIRVSNKYYEFDHVLILLFLFQIVIQHIETDDKKFFEIM